MKIYHLCPSGSLWIFNQKEVESREKGEALFQKKAKPGDVLKIEIPGQDIIKIVKILNTNNPMGKKESQFAKIGKQISKEEDDKKKKLEEQARDFFKRYTALTKETGFFINAVIECTENGIKPKITVALLKDNEDKSKQPPVPENPVAEPIAA